MVLYHLCLIFLTAFNQIDIISKYTKNLVFDKADLGGALAKALTADVNVVLADHGALVTADLARAGTGTIALGELVSSSLLVEAIHFWVFVPVFCVSTP